jgi:hypothetical protein
MRNEVIGYSRQNKAPQVKASTKTQGKAKVVDGNSNSTTDVELKEGNARYEKGMELYKQGKVSITSNGMFKVNGYEVDLRTPVRCECPDYQKRRRACKHIFAGLLFSKNRGKARVEHLDGFSNGNGPHAENTPKNAHNKPVEAHSKDFDRQTTITRLAVLNTTVEILKTHGQPIELEEVFFLASRLEAWALGS